MATYGLILPVKTCSSKGHCCTSGQWISVGHSQRGGSWVVNNISHVQAKARKRLTDQTQRRDWITSARDEWRSDTENLLWSENEIEGAGNT